MTVAIRPVVQRSVSKSQAVAPRRRRRGSCRCCAAVNFGGRPGAGFAVKALRPRRRTTSRQRITELCEHPSRRATSVTDAPAFSSSIPRRRRRSSSSGLPCGRMPRQYRARHQMSITYAHVNNAANDGQSPAQAYAASLGPPPALHREARADRSPSLERLIRPRLVDPDHLLALRALEPAADHARQTDIAYDAARFELYLLDRVLDVT